MGKIDRALRTMNRPGFDPERERRNFALYVHGGPPPRPHEAPCQCRLCYCCDRMGEDGYLLDSPSPNRLWFWFTSGVKDPIQRDGLDCQRLLHEAKEELAAAF
jgi:hypothetical protein